MKIKHLVMASAMIVSFSTFAQKDELKGLKKIYEKQTFTDKDIVEYKATLVKADPLIAAATEADKVYFDYYKAVVPFLEIKLAYTKPENAANTKLSDKYFTPDNIAVLAKTLNAVKEFEKKSGKALLTKSIDDGVVQAKPFIVNYAVRLGEEKKYKEAGSVLYSVYQMDKNDPDKLFYAASFSVNARDYDSALVYYNELKQINYTGETTLFWAYNKASKQEETFNSKNEREIFIKSGSHEKPRDEKTASKRGEIFKNIALILVEKGKIEEAKAAVTEARNANPEDTSLILTEADLYLKVNDFDTYTKLVNQALANDPNNVNLVYNLGVIAGNANKLADAEKYYKRALEINPNYFNANFNLAELMLRADEKFVNEMNKLGTSEKDNKRYDVLKAEREKNFKAVLPYLEKAYELQPDNDAAKKTLMSVYNALEMTDKYKALKAKN
ncbi:tetratricopeptide repeat protein [Flavobacterium mekongense]|uniref:tetratricopeptide repeat protein n=1 Tax=Flavobacterium mekongense TaxID=3379707 RepID=UPI00399AC042